MSVSVYIFNPEHDLALANSDVNFNAPLLAQKLAADLAVIPLWFCDPNSFIIAENISNEWLLRQQNFFLALKNCSLGVSCEVASGSTVIPWGWDKAIRKSLNSKGLDMSLLPTDSYLEFIKQHSHRRVAAILSARLQADAQLANIVSSPALELTTIAEVKDFVSQNMPAVLKAPFSGSGKGLSWVCKSLEASQIGWCKNVIAKQGSVMAERVCDKLQDFAMLFSCEHKEVDFVGYSLFETDNGIYRSNTLMSNRQIQAELIARGIAEHHLLHVRRIVTDFLKAQIAHHYTGMLGVDMFVYAEEGKIKLHASVEINLRMTMGVLARRFYDNFVCQNSMGHFYVDFDPDAKALYYDHKTRLSTQPVSVIDGRIKSGYFCASDINPQSNYRLRVEVDTND